MGDLKQGARAQVFFDDQFLENTQSVSISKDGKKVPIETLAGLSGVMRGAGMVTIDLTSYVPVGGPEFDFDAYLNSDDLVKAQVGFGPKTYVGMGSVTKVDTAQSGPDSPGVESVSWFGKLTANK